MTKLARGCAVKVARQRCMKVSLGAPSDGAQVNGQVHVKVVNVDVGEETRC
jgi:hypothetical protein